MRKIRKPAGMGPCFRGDDTVVWCATLAVFACIASVMPALADDLADFYRGKTVALTVSSGAGGGYDTLGRTVARFLGRYIPGNPIVFVRNMAGANGIAAANYLYGAAKDGTQIGLLQTNTPFEPLQGARDARYDPARFEWLGTPNVETGLLVVWNTVPVNTLAEARQREITAGTAGVNSMAAFHVRLFNDVFGTKLKAVGNYPGQTEAFYAMERGDLEAYPSVIYSALLVLKSDWLPQGKIKALVHYGPEKRPELASVPYAPELPGNADDKTLLEVAFAPFALGRPFVMPPGVPADRVAAMRKALADTFADREFQAESKRLALGADSPRDGAYIQDGCKVTFCVSAFRGSTTPHDK
jgi:tripartite-type tricarboxylate transporter receptor subunit TctC